MFACRSVREKRAADFSLRLLAKARVRKMKRFARRQVIKDKKKEIQRISGAPPDFRRFANRQYSARLSISWPRLTLEIKETLTECVN